MTTTGHLWKSSDNSVRSLAETTDVNIKDVIKIFNAMRMKYMEKSTAQYRNLNHPCISSLIKNYRSGLRVHLYGRPGSGKTSLAASIAAVMADLHNKVLWVDASWSYPDQFLGSQFNEHDNLYISRDINIEEIIMATSLFDMIIIDDITCKDWKTQIPRLGVSASKNNCDLLIISQVRRDIFGTKDLVPAEAIMGADLILNIKRSELRDHERQLWRHTIRAIHYRGELKRRDISLEIDFHGIDLGLFTYYMARENGHLERVKKDKIMLTLDGKDICAIGEFRQHATEMRYNYNYLSNIWSHL